MRKAGKEFQIIDKMLQRDCLRSIIKENSEKEIGIEDAIEFIAKQKESLDAVSPDHPMQCIFVAYQAKLNQSGMKDFSDLILDSVTLLRNDKKLVRHYHRKFSHILVDELQDLSELQLELINLLAGQSTSLWCVGDSDQAIYGWRGAADNAMEIMRQKHTEAAFYQFTENKRCSGNITSAASKLITHNHSSNPKKQSTPNHKGKGILVYAAKDKKDEARFIANKIRELLKEGYTPSQIAVIARRNKNLLPLIAKILVKAGIGCDNFSATPKLDKGISLLLDYLRAVCNLHTNYYFERILNSPCRGIGKKTIAKIKENAKNNQSSYYVASRRMCKNGKGNASLTVFSKKLRKWKKLADQRELRLLIIKIAKELLLHKKKTLHPLLKEILPWQTLEMFLDNFLLNQDLQQTGALRKKNTIKLMTIHAAKGLEFDIVFLPGWEDGLFPDYRALDSGSTALKEERRVAYVALTRAKERLAISYIPQRRLHRYEEVYPSRFLLEMGLEVFTSTSKKLVKSHLNLEDRNSRKTTDINIGDPVSDNTPERYGYGYVRDIQGTTLTIEFRKGFIKLQINEVTKV